MILDYSAPWHKASFDRFLGVTLPQLLAERLPLAGYAAEPAEGENTVSIRVAIRANGDALEVTYGPLPVPAASGVITLGGRPHVVVPVASQEELDKATIQCSGEQLYDFIAARLAQAPAGLAWDESLARTLLPLDDWFGEFYRQKAQPLDETNWHASTTHLRRLLIPTRQKVVAEGQHGRVDPFETPEGPNIGLAFTVAYGAAIEDRRLVIHDSRPEAALGHNSILIPFLQHDDPNRLLMGVNMMRQAIPPEDPEPPLVQTGYEPQGRLSWNGYNLLTAFVAWGEGSVSDGLVISESCARRLHTPYPAGIGDKLANRHGTKGVVAQILPDAQMPHLPDGTPVEICFSFTGMARRMNLGQSMEALAGWIAHTKGGSIMAPPFQGPSLQALKGLLGEHHLPETGLVQLRDGKDGPALELTSAIGWVYWYRLAHLAGEKPLIFLPGRQTAAGIPDRYAERGALTERELLLLRRAGAGAVAREMLTGQSTRWTEESQAEPGGSPYLDELAERLAPAGIRVRREGASLAFALEPPGGGSLRLAAAVKHPWLPEQKVEQVGPPPTAAGESARRAFEALAAANEQLSRLLARGYHGPQLAGDSAAGPAPYLETLRLQVEQRLAAYFDALLPQRALAVREPQKTCARSVIAPGIGLRLDQVGLPETICAALFPQPGEIEQRWVIVAPPPGIQPAGLVAFHPLAVPGAAIRLHPQACGLLDVDFDGDQVLIFVPQSPEAQREAGEKLSVEGHLRQNPALAAQLFNGHDAVWGAAWASLKEEGRREIAAALQVEPDAVPGPLTQAEAAAFAQALAARDPAAAAAALEALARTGYAAARRSGASMTPFLRDGLELPPQPQSDDPADWEPYLEALAELIKSLRDFTNPVRGPQELSMAVRSARGPFLQYVLGPKMVPDINGKPWVIRQSPAEGLSAESLFTQTVGARLGLARLALESEQFVENLPGASPVEPAPLTPLARARRSKRPGIILARAAAAGERYAPRDAETRLLIGLLPL